MPIDLARRLAMEGLLSDEEFAAVVARRAAFAEPVPVALQALRATSAEVVAGVFDRLGFAPASRLTPASIVPQLPAGLLRTLWALPIGESPAGFVVAMADPTDSHALTELAYHLRKPVDPRWAPIEALRRVLDVADPPVARVTTQTHPAPAPPPPAAELGPSVVRLPAGGITDEMLSLVRKTPRRRLTPAYGERALGTADGGDDGAGSAATPPGVGLGARKLQVGATAIGAFRTTPAKLAPPPPELAEVASVGERPLRDSEAPIPLRRRSRGTNSISPAFPVSRDAMFALGELNGAADRDAVARIVAKGMTVASQRAAFFVVKRGVVQGWEGATIETHPGAGMSREALRNLWIPVTTPSVFRRVSERGGVYLGPLSESTADSILAAALGGRPSVVLLAPIEVRGHVLAFLYADGLRDPAVATKRAEELVRGAVEALERLLLQGRGKR